MIERLIKNEISLKKWRAFKSHKTAVVSCWFLGVVAFFSFTAEYWANSKPLLLYKDQQIYFPVTQVYHPSRFGREDIMEMDYRSLDLRPGDWALWPPLRWNPYEANEKLESYPAPPSPENWLGTDDRGRDLFARLLYGFRYSFGFAMLVWVGSLAIGMVLGAVMGYFGGAIDLYGQRFVELWESLPYLLLLLILIATFNPSLSLFIVLNVLFGWMIFAAYVRAEFLRLRRQSFVEAAIAAGATPMRVIFRHVLPNGLGPVFAFSPFVVSSNIILLSSLDYLGLGLPPPTPSWGELFKQAKNHIMTGWWLALFTSLAIFMTLVLLNLIGEAVRDTFDPRT